MQKAHLKPSSFSKLLVRIGVHLWELLRVECVARVVVQEQPVKPPQQAQAIQSSKPNHVRGATTLSGHMNDSY